MLPSVGVYIIARQNIVAPTLGGVGSYCVGSYDSAPVQANFPRSTELSGRTKMRVGTYFMYVRPPLIITCFRMFSGDFGHT